MSLDRYKADGLLFNQNFLEETSEAGLKGYRGELVLIEGGIADEKGHAKPPEDVMRGVAILASDKIQLIIGAIDDIKSLPTFVSKYGADFTANMIAVIYVVNIDKPAQVSLGEQNFVLIPLQQGVPWNEIIDELALEKSDFKGMSAADKIVKLRDELKEYKPTYPAQSFDEVLASATTATREGWGAV